MARQERHARHAGAGQAAIRAERHARAAAHGHHHHGYTHGHTDATTTTTATPPATSTTTTTAKPNPPPPPPPAGGDPTYTATNSTTDVWSAGTNWTGGTAPVSGATTELNYGGALGPLTNTNTNDIGAFQLNILDLAYTRSNSGSGNTSITIASSAGKSLNFVSNGSTTPVVNLTGTYANSGKTLTFTVSSPVTLTNNTLFTGSPASGFSAIFNFSGVISGGGSLSKSGTSTLTLSGANTYTGATTISGGTLSVSSLANGGVASNIGQSTNAAANLVFDGGTLQYTGGSVSTDRNFTINTGKTATIDVSTTATNLTISGASTATNGALTKVGTGTLTLTGANLYTGATNINAGTLSAGAAGALGSGTTIGTTQITVNSGGTLLLSGSAGVTDRIRNNATVNLASGGSPGTGGIFNTGGLSEGTAPTGGVGTGAVGLGALTLNSNSTIDFNAPGSSSTAGGSALVFQSLASFVSGTALTIAHWTGNPNQDGSDRLLFVTDPGLTLAQLANVQFTTDAGTLFALGAREITFNGMFEIVPVPEPSTWVAGALALGAAVYMQRRRLRELVRRVVIS